ncbi:MAG: TVP38/TMEM64 family protein [Sandaracinus sp.]|nr:TVP38/TMEM64 family protein [Sandaracinus sp.]MCB9614556.1 TVP38/TMEM64 family protein [Sandaracinus sp.]MCB9620665.1 TVP38/TMEM64 family protein [Sandaracinus sp.]MCB9622962.1 TVP38/TMEM64 family protein [Sandaracinus sp.]
MARDPADETAVGPSPRARALRIGLVAAAAGLLVVAWRLGILDVFAEPERLRTWIVERGAWGQLAFVIAFALLQPFGVPGTVFVLVAPLLWPWPEAYALSMVGVMIASTIGFSFARFVARDWVERRVPAKFRRYEDALARRGFFTVFALRFVLWMPPALHAFFGVSRVSFATHFWASLVGYALPLLGMAYFGERLFEWLAEVPASVWLATGAVLVVAAIGVVVAVMRKRRRAANA